MQYLILDIDWRFLNYVYFHQKVSDYLLFAVIVMVTFMVKKPIAGLLTRVSSRLAQKYTYIEHKETLRNMLFVPVEYLLQVIFYFIATNQLSNILNSIVFHRDLITRGNLNITLGDITDHIFLFLFIFFLTQSVTRFIDFIYYLRIGKAREEKNQSKEQMLPLIKEISKLLAWTIGGFWVLGSVFHVNIPALITGLGIGGIAIALASKETVENFFAAFTILSDKPFHAGDSIKIGEIEGIVERIGFRSTRLRNLDGSEYIIPNQHLVSQNLINLSNRNTRGMKVVANVRYGITHAELEKLIAELKETLAAAMPLTEISAIVENFDKETFQLVIAYRLPHPMPQGAELLKVKQETNMKIFEIINNYAKLGTANSA